MQIRVYVQIDTHAPISSGHVLVLLYILDFIKTNPKMYYPLIDKSAFFSSGWTQ